MPAKLSNFDRENMDRLLAGDFDWFSAKLMRLIMKADTDNKELLRQVFPDHVQAYDDYVRGEDVND